MGYFGGWGRTRQLFWGSTYVVEQLSFSLFLSILTFDFDLILGSFFTFRGPNGPFLRLTPGFSGSLGVSLLKTRMKSNHQYMVNSN